MLSNWGPASGLVYLLVQNWAKYRVAPSYSSIHGLYSVVGCRLLDVWTYRSGITLGACYYMRNMYSPIQELSGMHKLGVA